MKLKGLVVCIATLALAGCQMPSASLQLIGGLESVLAETSAGQEHIRAAIVSQLDWQAESLDAAFVADLRNLASGNQRPATQPEQLIVLLDDVLLAKRLYDARRVELDASRAGVAETFQRLDNNLAASRQMADMLRRLVLQQNALAGQADLAMQTLLGHIRQSGK